MIGGHSIANLLKHGGLTGARRGHDQPAGALADGGYQIDYAGFDNVRIGFEIEFIKRVNGGEIFKT